VTTASLDETSAAQLLIARVRDQEALRAQIKRALGGFHTERTGGAEVWVGADSEGRAAAFIGDYLILGELEDVRRCIAAHATARTLAASDAYQRAARLVAQSAETGVVTFFDQRAQTRLVITVLSKQRTLRTGAPTDAIALARLLDERAYAVSETRAVDDGFERGTRSPFGQFGTIIAQLGAESSK
jgi:hypothetical protein